MQVSLSNLYNQLLKNFKFSISGYSNPEKEVSDFFYSLCRNDLVAQNEIIRVLMFGFAQLSSDVINQIDFTSWETKPLRKFNYFDYSFGYAEVLLSLYVHCLHEICPGKRAVNIISDNIRRDINLRIAINSDSTVDRFVFKENKRFEALDILVPRTLFRGAESSFDYNSFEHDGKRISSFVKQDPTFDHEFIITPALQAISRDPYRELAKRVFEISPSDFAMDIESYLPPKDVQTLIRTRTLGNPNANLRDVLAIAYSASLFCHFFRCTLEYFVSISNLSPNGSFSLGSIAVGVANGSELSFDQRAMFSLVSNHVASNLSAQIIRENNRALKLTYQRKALKDLFDKCDRLLKPKEKDYAHGVADVDCELLEKWNAQDVTLLGAAVPFACDPARFEPFLMKGERTHKGFLTQIYLDPQAKNLLCSRSLLYKSIKAFNRDRLRYVDVIFIEEFLKLLHPSRVDDSVFNEISTECYRFEENGKKLSFIEATIVFADGGPFEMSTFYSRLANTHKGGHNLTSFILENYKLFRLYGDLSFIDEEGISHFCLSKDVKLTKSLEDVDNFTVLRENISDKSFKCLSVNFELVDIEDHG
jgi:hypothetical protein